MGGSNGEKTSAAERSGAALIANLATDNATWLSAAILPLFCRFSAAFLPGRDCWRKIRLPSSIGAQTTLTNDPWLACMHARRSTYSLHGT